MTDLKQLYLGAIEYLFIEDTEMKKKLLIACEDADIVVSILCLTEFSMAMSPEFTQQVVQHVELYRRVIEVNRTMNQEVEGKIN